jgi:hypothetical protein
LSNGTDSLAGACGNALAGARPLHKISMPWDIIAHSKIGVE